MFDGVTDLMNKYNTEDMSMYAITYVNHYQKLQDIIQTEYMSYMAGEHFYGEQYLADLFLATEYTKADVIGKKNFFEWENGALQEDGAQEDYEFVSGLTYHRSLLKTTIPMMGTVPVLLGNMENDGSMAHYFRQGVSLFSSDKFNFVAYGAEAPMNVLTKVEI